MEGPYKESLVFDSLIHEFLVTSVRYLDFEGILKKF